MHNNYYFLLPLSTALSKRLQGCVVSECFSQNKDELILRFETETTPFFIKANVESDFSCLSFPDVFHRAKKNSVDLFEPLIGQRVVSIRQFKNERSFAIQFEDGRNLLFKMHGNRSNCILFRKNEVEGLFRNNLPGDGSIDLHSLDREIDWSVEHFKKNINRLKEVYFTFGKVVWLYLEKNGFDKKDADEKWQDIQHLLHLLTTPVFYLTRINEIPTLSLVPLGTELKEYTNPVKAITDFFYSHAQLTTFAKEKNSASTSLRNRLAGSERYYVKTSDKLRQVENDTNYKTWADILMANLQHIPKGAEKITLPNFYENNLPVEIKLKRDASPQKNAEVFYKKSKNQHIEVQRLKSTLAAKANEIDQLKKQVEEIETIDNLKDLRKVITGTNRPETKKQEPPKPYREFEAGGYKIWVGKNAQGNDELTLKYAFKEDLWLHAKDVTGSHVVLKYQAGKTFPKNVIERAAELAAFYSKRKNETLCPVVVTPKKFVRKRKGDPPGAVVVDREEVIMVTPAQ